MSETEIRPPSRHKYNRRPTSRKIINGSTLNPSLFQSSSELCSNQGTDGKDAFFNVDSSGSQIVQDRIRPPEDTIRSDASSSSAQDKSDEEDILNMFFDHVRTTPVSKHHPHPERMTIKKTKEMYPLSRKPEKFSFPLDKQGKKKKAKNPQDNTRNAVLISEMNDEDSDELAFLTFDSGIQRRKCASGSMKDGKCRPPATIS